MSEKKEMRVQYLTGRRLGKSIEQIHSMLARYDKNIHDKIVIEVVPTTQLAEKDKEIEALNDCIELQKSGLKRFEKENKELKEFAREFWNCNKDLELQFHIENNFQDLISKLESEK